MSDPATSTNTSDLDISANTAQKDELTPSSIKILQALNLPKTEDWGTVMNDYFGDTIYSVDDDESDLESDLSEYESEEPIIVETNNESNKENDMNMSNKENDMNMSNIQTNRVDKHNDDPEMSCNIAAVDISSSVLKEVTTNYICETQPDAEREKAKLFKCKCQLYQKGPCYKAYSPDELFDKRMEMFELTPAEKHLVLLGMIRASIDTSDMTKKNKNKPTKRKHTKVTYHLNGQRICRKMFKFMHVISQDKLTNTIKFYQKHGVKPKISKTGGRKANVKSLSFEDVNNIVSFLLNYAASHGIVLPGRVPGYKRSDLQLLPSCETKASIWRVYRTAMEKSGKRAVAVTTFRRYWKQLLPNVVVTKPMTDLCFECHKNNASIYKSANLPDCVKTAKMKKQEDHLVKVKLQRAHYQELIEQSKVSQKQHGLNLEKHTVVSVNTTSHYSFDFAQQVHYPNDPLQPGPVYFLVPRKVGVFGICCEALPKQINYLVDEAHCVNKGSSSVISYLHHFFGNFGFGETDADLHCDNCSGQNKNRFMLYYLAWRVVHGFHKTISLNFLLTGHTKFSPDWCFGLFKKTYRRTEVSCLNDIVDTVKASSINGINQGCLVGDEIGNIFVESYNWQAFLGEYFKPLVQIKTYHHFRFDQNHPGTVFYKEFANSTEASFQMLKNPDCSPPAQLPEQENHPGLPDARQWYLFDKIRDFCSEQHKDLVAPKPTVVKP